MRKTKRLFSLIAAIMLCFCCFLFTGCKISDTNAPGTYHLKTYSYMEGDTMLTVNLNIFTNKLYGFSMKLVLGEDGTATMIEESEGVEIINKGTWKEKANGDVEMLFGEQTTVAVRSGKTLTVTDESTTMVFKKMLIEF